MVINRHNYEEFFLLYVDNELTPEDKLAVDNFILRNADLAEELEMFKQVTLPEENIAFEQKELLYKQAEGISQNNYEEYFLLSVDKELTEQGNEEVEKFVLKHPQLQSEYLQLKQTRLEPENIAFDGKEKLYRKEGKERRVIFVSWMRMTAAASIIGLAVIFWVLSNNNKYSSGNSIVLKGKTVELFPEKTKQPVRPAVAEERIVMAHKEVSVKVEAIRKDKMVETRQSKETDEALAINSEKNKQEQLALEPADAFETAEGTSQKKSASDNSIASTTVTNKNNLPPTHEGLSNATFTNRKDADLDATIAKHAVYLEIDNQEDDEENSFYIGSAEINKNKLKGLFKKATSLFEKKSNKNDGERTLKIAGFEIKSR